MQVASGGYFGKEGPARLSIKGDNSRVSPGGKPLEVNLEWWIKNSQGQLHLWIN